MKLIRKRCACGCGQITNPGRRWIVGHNRRRIKVSKETRKKLSLAGRGNINAEGREGKHHSEETKNKMALSHFKCNPNRQYCDVWRDKEYKDDLRKDDCENVECKGNYTQLLNHHINLNKKDCRPSNVMTLCKNCHMLLHHKLGLGANHKDYLTIIRTNKITYIHKATKRAITIIQRKEN
jgi:hypothetical protein